MLMPGKADRRERSRAGLVANLDKELMKMIVVFHEIASERAMIGEGGRAEGGEEQAAKEGGRGEGGIMKGVRKDGTKGS
eukprot:405918-Hanusia_phi.AAC.1